MSMSLMKGRTEKSNENGSTGSNRGGGGSGNNSDNSAISLGNTSFGFNFDSEEGMMNSSPRNSSNSDEGDSDGQVNFQNKQRGGSGKPKAPVSSKPGLAQAQAQPGSTSSTAIISADLATSLASHSEAAAAAVANLQSIASESIKNAWNNGKSSLKRKAHDNGDNDSGGYNTDDETADGASKQDGTEAGDSGGEDNPKKKKKRLNDMKREERNAREKERSFRISRQISELRGLLSSGGVIVPKGTKSSVLTEAANYIRMLQQHQYRSEIDRHQLVQQIQMIGGGALGQQAATTVRHVAAQNGVWSLGNFGGVPPKSAMMHHEAGTSPVPSDPGIDTTVQQPEQKPAQDGSVLPNRIEDPDYRFVFNSCTVGMAIASMGGAFIDCNKLFCQLANYSKQEVCSMTIFNLTARQDLQHAFDLISQMLSAPADSGSIPTMSSCVLRGSLKQRTDLGLSVTLIKGEDDGVAKCFCVTLVLNPMSPFDTGKPMPATMEHIHSTQGLQQVKDSGSGGMDPTPAYTTG